MQFNTSIAVPSTEVCNAEWQSRGVAEIIFKSIAVHSSTLVLVAEYADALNMPRGGRICFLLSAALYPIWTAVALVLRFVTVYAARILPRLVKRKRLQEPLLVFSEAVDMHAEASPDHSEGSASRSDLFEPDPPPKIPLQELKYFRCRNPETAGIPTQVGFSLQPQTAWSVRRSRLGLAATICLSLAYLVQAFVTIYLTSRRASFDQTSWQSAGLPVAPGPRWLPYDKMPSNAKTTFADTQGFALSILGITIAIPYLLLRIFDMRWEYASQDNPVWTYECDDYYAITRSLMGMLGALLINVEIGMSIGPTTSLKLLTRTVEPLAKMYGHAKLATLVSCTPSVACAAWALGFLLRQWLMGNPSWPSRALAQALLLPHYYLSSFDYGRQFPILHAFVSNRVNKNHIAQYRQRRAEIRYTLYLFIYFISGVALFVYHITGLAHTLLQQTGNLIPAVSAQSGCIYTTQLYPWMWKDPLADRLWAF